MVDSPGQAAAGNDCCATHLKPPLVIRLSAPDIVRTQPAHVTHWTDP